MVRAFPAGSPLSLALCAIGLAASGCKEPTPLEGVTDVTAGNGFTCAIADGELWCWGWNEYTGTGKADAFEDDLIYATRVEGFREQLVSLSSDYQNACALTSDGRVFCWGDNDYGQTGTGSDKLVISEPTEVEGLEGVIQISVSDTHACALLEGGAVMCWGNNTSRQIGIEADSQDPVPTPTQVAGLAGEVVSIDAGSGDTCAVLSDGSAQCWGAGINSGGQPRTVEGLTDAAEIALGYDIAYVRRSDGSVQAWGRRPEWLGLGLSWSDDEVKLPADVPELEAGVTALDVACAVVSGEVWCIKVEGGYFEQVDGLKEAVDISPGYGHTCAVERGQALCWGDKNPGAIGNGPYDLGEDPIQKRPAPALVE